MKKNILFIAAFSVAVCTACNNDNTKATGETAGVTEATADSLFKEVMKGHDIGMVKTPQLPRLQERAKQLIDSLGKLPAAAREAAAGYKSALDSLHQQLGYADFAMDKWMKDFDVQIAKNGPVSDRITYLEAEKSKIDKVTAAILGSLKKADSLRVHLP